MTETPFRYPARASAVIVGAGIVGNSLAVISPNSAGPISSCSTRARSRTRAARPFTHRTSSSGRPLEGDDAADTRVGAAVTARRASSPRAVGSRSPATEERMQELQRRVASAKAWGIEDVAILTPAQVKASALHRGGGDRRRLLHALGGHRRLAAFRNDGRASAHREGRAGGVRENLSARHRRRGRARDRDQDVRVATSIPIASSSAAVCGDRR